jgi:hypothetical protein
VEIPARNEIAAPLLGDDPIYPFGHIFRKGAEGITVEIHHTGREIEPTPQALQGIIPIEALGV